MESTALAGKDSNIIFRKIVWSKVLLTKKFSKVMYLRFSGCQRPRLGTKQPDNLGGGQTRAERVSDRMRPSANS